MAKVVVDQNTCIGCGVCAALCPKVYEMSPEDGKSHVVAGMDTVTDADDVQGAKDGESACPVDAITVED